MSDPSATAVKTLFAESRNLCFFNDPERALGCEQLLTDPAWEQVKGQIAHIKGEKPGAARYDAAQPDKQRQGYGNLLLLCPTCHTRVDRLEPSYYTVERLHAMKERHLAHPADREWATPEQLVRYTALAIAEYTAAQTSGAAVWAGSGATLAAADVEQRAAEAWAVLVRVERDRASGGIEVINDSSEPLRQPDLTPVSGGWRGDELAGLRPASVDPGTRWRAGFLPADHADPTRPPYRVELGWTDQSGSRRVARYDL